MLNDLGHKVRETAIRGTQATPSVVTASVSVIIPAKNEAGPLGKLLEEILALGIASEIVVVDDGSGDGTAEVAREGGARVVSHRYSVGNGGAVKSGARAAVGDVLLFMDADGQHRPEEIPQLIAKVNEGYDMVVGARKKDSQANVGRGLANRFYNSLASYMTGQRVEDLTSGFRAVRADRFREFLYLLPNGFSYPTTSTMAFFRAGYQVCYVPIEARKRVGNSHVRPLKDGVRFLLIIFKIGSLYSPLKLFAPTSLVIFLTGLGYYLHTFITQGRFTNMSALLFTAAIMVFLMGLISEQITALMYKDGPGR